MEFKELIEAFADEHAIDGVGVNEGTAAIIADGIRVEFIEDAAYRRILVCAEIGEARADFGHRLADMMLDANFLLRGTDGATLCRNPDTQTYAIVEPLPLAMADPQALGALVESLIAQVERWRKVVDGFEIALEAEYRTDEDNHDFLFRGHLMV